MYYLPKQEIFRLPKNHLLRDNSYFGYSITYDESNKKLVISAPNEDNYGEVYYCNIEDKACKRIDKKYRNVLSDYPYWFGATVKAGRDFVMICAPRYNELKTAKGTCFFYVNSNLTKSERISKAEIFADAGLSFNTPHGQLAMDSFGWSIDIASDGSIMVGGPGMYHGRVMIYKNISETPNLIRRTEHTPKFNFGYAVASGFFINESLSYAVGSTYGIIGYGQVSFYKDLKFIEISNNPLNASNIGSMFGAVLCAATLSGNRTDLLVGAPTYATNSTYNLGAVYVYLALTNNAIPVFKRKIVGQVSGSMFGTAIVNVGDLNGDEKHEIAVSAPFEREGHGVVYVYSGADLISELTERDLKYLQRIEPEISYGESFGMSLTALQDFDENGCKELAIGSPFNNTVVLVRCVAEVDVETSTKSPNLQGRATSNITDFKFEVCLSIKYPSLPKKIIALISTTVEMFDKYAKLIHTNNTNLFTYETSLNEKKPEYCKNVSFSLPPEYDTKIEYTISSKLLNDPRTLPNFNSSRVIISNRSILTIQNSFWPDECMNTGNNTCVPNLMLTPYISFYHDGDPYIIGSSITENMSITIYNGRDVAYEACVRVHIIGVNVLTIPTGCAYESLANVTRLVCKPPKPIRTNKTWTIGQIALQMTHLTNLDKNIFIKMLLFERCMDNFTKSIPKIIPVMADPHGITSKGETDIGSTVHMTNDDINKNGKKMQHIYTIMNKGPTNWKQLQIQVILQMQPYIEYDTDTPVTVYDSTSNSYTSCLSKNNKSYVCLVESLMTKVEFARIHIPIHIVPGTLGKIIDKHRNATITSSIILKFIDHDKKVESITTILTLLEATVPIEATILAIVVGLSIIIIATLILYKVGFLRRKNKEALEKLKTSVKRQSNMGTSTMQSDAPAGDDQSPILDQEE